METALSDTRPPAPGPEWHRRELRRLQDRARRARELGAESLLAVEKTNPDGSITRRERIATMGELRAERRERERVSETYRHARRLDPLAASRRRRERLAALDRRARARTVTTTIPAPSAAPMRGPQPRQRRAQRPATRARGRSGSSPRSGGGGDPPPGDDDPDADEPARGRRPCGCGCGEQLPAASSARARYVDPRHAARARKRAQRERERDERRARVEGRARCESCGAYLSRYAAGGDVCAPCALAGEPSTADEALARWWPAPAPPSAAALRRAEREAEATAAAVRELQALARERGITLGRERALRLLDRDRRSARASRPSTGALSADPITAERRARWRWLAERAAARRAIERGRLERRRPARDGLEPAPEPAPLIRLDAAPVPELIGAAA